MLKNLRAGKVVAPLSETSASRLVRTLTSWSVVVSVSFPLSAPSSTFERIGNVVRWPTIDCTFCSASRIGSFSMLNFINKPPIVLVYSIYKITIISGLSTTATDPTLFPQPRHLQKVENVNKPVDKLGMDQLSCSQP